MKKLALALFLSATSLFGISLGSFQVSPELGVNLGYQNDAGNRFTYGAYGRVWLGVSRIVIAPQVKYDWIAKSGENGAYSNLQVGGLIGFDIPVLPLTPYIGASYSSFDNIGLKDTASLNYGIKVKFPIIPIAIGIDGTYQKPKITSGGRYEINRIGLTIALSF